MQRACSRDVVEEFQPTAETGTGQPSRVFVRACESTGRTGEHSNEWRKVLRRLCSSRTWTTALKMQGVVVRNAAGSIACAWIPNAIYTFGNIFSGKWYIDQSRNELLVSNSVYAGITFCAVVFTSFLPMMMTLRFSNTPNGRPTAWFCIKKLFRATRVSLLVTMVILFGFSSFIIYLNAIEPLIFTFKIECYADNLILLGFFTCITRAVKQIFYEETCEGRDRQQLKKQKSRRSKIFPNEMKSKTPQLLHQPPFWKAYLKSLPMTSASFLAGLFVHILSQQRLVDRGNAVLTSFVVVEIVFKLAIQEVAKHYIFKKRVRSARIMCVLVGIPTVLVDTQTRIILLGTNSTTAVMGTLGMALVEVTLRAGKAVLVMLEIRHRKSTLERTTASTIQRRTVLHKFVRSSPSITSEAPKTRRRTTTTGLSEQELWRRQVHAFHTAELNADMYAEYISIGCSASILFFYGNHPHYWLLRKTEAAGIDVVAWRVAQLQMLGLQIGVEIVVDYVSFVLEMVIGIEFDHVKNLGSFLGALFMIAAVMNITISIGYYLS